MEFIPRDYVAFRFLHLLKCKSLEGQNSGTHQVRDIQVPEDHLSIEIVLRSSAHVVLSTSKKTDGEFDAAVGADQNGCTIHSPPGGLSAAINGGNILSGDSCHSPHTSEMEAYHKTSKSELPAHRVCRWNLVVVLKTLSLVSDSKMSASCMPPRHNYRYLVGQPRTSGKVDVSASCDEDLKLST